MKLPRNGRYRLIIRSPLGPMSAGIWNLAISTPIYLNLTGQRRAVMNDEKLCRRRDQLPEPDGHFIGKKTPLHG